MFEEAALVPIILGFVEMAKRMGVPVKFSPLVAVALGVGFALLLNGLTVDSGIVGLGLGLMASGLYSGGKAIVKK